MAHTRNLLLDEFLAEDKARGVVAYWDGAPVNFPHEGVSKVQKSPARRQAVYYLQAIAFS